MQTSQTDDNKILGESQLVDKTESGEEPLETASGEEEQPEGETTAASDYFSQARLSRQQARDEAVSIFKQTSENPSADAQSKEQAEASIATMAENAQKDVCSLTNPRTATKEQIIEVFSQAYEGI